MDHQGPGDGVACVDGGSEGAAIDAQAGAENSGAVSVMFTVATLQVASGWLQRAKPKRDPSSLRSLGMTT